MFNRAPVSDDIQRWLTNEFEWAITEGLLTPGTPLVTPEQKYFPAPKGTPETVVKGLIGNILDLLGYGEDDIDVLPLERPDAEHRAAGSFQEFSEQAAAYAADDTKPTILYDTEMIGRPSILLATLVHEVMHHVLHKFPDAQADANEEELRTDAHMITTGFGLIAMLGAEEAGWLGYMRQPTRAHGLAMFLSLFDSDHRDIENWLSGRMTKAVRRSLRFIDKTDAVGPLKDKLAAQAA